MWHIKQCSIVVNFNPTNEAVCKVIGFFLDNCASQNNNSMDLWSLIFLVESNICKQDRAIFLVFGNTNNYCGCLFNLLKIQYFKQNIYSTDKALNNSCNNNIYAARVEESIFRNWYKLEYKFFKRIPSDTIKSNNIFRFNDYKQEKYVCRNLIGIMWWCYIWIKLKIGMKIHSYLRSLKWSIPHESSTLSWWSFMINGIHFCLVNNYRSKNTILRILQRRSGRGSRKTPMNQRALRNIALVSTTTSMNTDRSCLVLKIIILNLNYM